MPCFRVLFTAVALLSAALQLTAQQSGATPAEPIETIHAETNLVVLDMVVHDQRGRPVTGLTREDFTVLEDGKPQTIRSFETTNATSVIPEKAALNTSGHPDWGSAPLTILVIDELTTNFEAMAYARFELEQYLKRQPALLHSPTKLLAVNDKGFEEIEPYTRERDVMLATVRQRRVGLPSALFRDDHSKLVAGTFSALKQIALASAGEKDERKNLIWIGTGFSAIHYYDMPDSTRRIVEAVVRDTTTSLLRARIVVYVIDPQGLVVNVPQIIIGDNGVFAAIGLSGTQHFSQALVGEITLNTFASQTGGRYVFNRNDVDVAVGNSIADLEHSYALSYSPANLVRDGAYRKITVKANRPGLTVQTRGGYFAPGGDAATLPQRDSEFDLATAASNSMNYSGVGTSITSLASGDKPRTVAIVVRVELKNLQWTYQPDGSADATFTLAAIAQNAARKLVKSHVRRVSIHLPESKIEEIKHGSIDVNSDLPLVEKAPHLRVLVRDSDGLLGSADADPAVLAALQAKISAANVEHKPTR